VRRLWHLDRKKRGMVGSYPRRRGSVSKERPNNLETRGRREWGLSGDLKKCEGVLGGNVLRRVVKNLEVVPPTGVRRVEETDSKRTEKCAEG